MKPLLLFFLFLLCLQFAYSQKNVISTDRNVPCDTTTFHLDNTENDTSKAVFISAVVFDTTACMIHGYLVDEKSFQPIRKATVILRQVKNEFQTTSNANGEFQFFNALVCYAEIEDLVIAHTEYKCMTIKCKQTYGGIWMKIKLKEK